jgi:hypothetical protein
MDIEQIALMETMKKDLMTRLNEFHLHVLKTIIPGDWSTIASIRISTKSGFKIKYRHRCNYHKYIYYDFPQLRKKIKSPPPNPEQKEIELGLHCKDQEFLTINAHVDTYSSKSGLKIYVPIEDISNSLDQDETDKLIEQYEKNYNIPEWLIISIIHKIEEIGYQEFIKYFDIED